MFKYLYSYYNNLIDTPCNMFKLNLWSFCNTRIHKIKLTSHIVYFLSNLLSIQQNYIKIVHKNFNFDGFFFFFFFLNFIVVAIFICIV